MLAWLLIEMFAVGLGFAYDMYRCVAVCVYKLEAAGMDYR